MAPAYKQDLPPAGGYQSIEWSAKVAKRIPEGKATVPGWAYFAAFTVFTFGAWQFYWYQKRRNKPVKRSIVLKEEVPWQTHCLYIGFVYMTRWLEVEMNDARIAVTPFITAEHQRYMLKHLVKNRDEEAELMKNVPNWKVGTWYGEPVYHNLRDRFMWPTVAEFYAHNKYKDMYKTMTDHLDRS